MRRSPIWLPPALVLSLSACSTLGYYVHSVKGHLELMRASRPIEAVLADPDTPEPLKRRLETVLAMRAFAVEELGLPDSGSYRSFVDLGRSHVVWTVVAAPEFSLAPKEWCFPVAGCVSYRGYYERTRAEAFAQTLGRAGYDVAVNGVRAYSTLGWFDDPVPDAILTLPDHALAGTIFHELAHERLYVAGDSAFNEAFAVTVERAGVARWLDARGSPQMQERFALLEARERVFLELLAQTRARLERLYASDARAADKRRRKAAIFRDLRARYQELRSGWVEAPDYDAWFEDELNNAKLVAVATYHRWVPAFERLLAAHAGSLPRFYDACEALARLPPERRARRLEALARTAASAVSEDAPRDRGG